MHFFSKIVLIVSFTVAVEACKCIPPNQQTAYCRSAWISHAKIIEKQILENSIEYTVQHLEIFKNNTSPLSNKVLTPSSSAACGVVNLIVGEEYLLSGYINDETKTLKLSNCLYMPDNDLHHSGILTWSRVPTDLYQKLLKKDFKPCPINETLRK
ncbi:hypothetical protein FO519_000083 [Halicephalobus sp. NKZ332]|nr:hypothetical protein FO519_000083 [Halicephalobus sp. NKZ332]